MATIRAFQSIEIEDGDLYDGDATSSFAIPGSAGYSSLTFYAHFWLGIAVLDNNQAYIGLFGGFEGPDGNEGIIATEDPATVFGGRWTSYFMGSHNQFAWELGSGLVSGGPIEIDEEIGDMQGSNGDVWIWVPEKVSRLTPGQEVTDAWMRASGFWPAGDITTYEKSTRIEDDQEITTLYYYIAGPVHNWNGAWDTLVIYGTRIGFDIIDDILPPVTVETSWYPWARDKSGTGEFWSHNRIQPEQGSLTRYIRSSQTWRGCINKSKTEEGSTVVVQTRGSRYDGTGFQQSPILGTNGQHE